jgi:cell division protease FtsH
VKQKFLDRICVLLGGRAGEEIFLGRIGSGAANDIKHVTNLARAMVTRLGMSEKLGPIAYEESTEQVFLGRDYSRRQVHSEKTLQEIDTEVSRIVAEQLDRARTLLKEHEEKVQVMAEALLERETLDKEEVEMVMKGEELPPPALEETPATVATTAEDSAQATDQPSEDIPGNGSEPEEAVGARIEEGPASTPDPANPEPTEPQNPSSDKDQTS